MVRVFISSVQKEFSEERKALVKYIREDVLLCKFFQPFIFEELPAINLSAPEAYLYEAAHSPQSGNGSRAYYKRRPPAVCKESTAVFCQQRGEVYGIPDQHYDETNPVASSLPRHSLRTG